MLQPEDITRPGRYRYYEIGVDKPQWVDIVRSSGELVVRWDDMDEGDVDCVPLDAVAGWFEPLPSGS